MGKIYVTGHKNPDMDSLCAAYAYANLKNYEDPENEYKAIRCGHISDAVKAVLNTMNIQAPPYMQDLYPKVKDVMMTMDMVEDTAPLNTLSSGEAFMNGARPVIPISHEGVFTGLLSLDHIAAWLMKELNASGEVTHVPTIHEIISDKSIMGDQPAPVQAEDLFKDTLQKLVTTEEQGLAVFDGDQYVGVVTRSCFLKTPRKDVILVDHNEPRQSIQGIEEANIVEIIDHHRIDSVHTENPVFIDAEPLGSTCTIVYQLYTLAQAPISERVARVLLAGILSDTVILKSPTTTPTDVRVAKILAGILETDVQEFGMKMFSQVKGLSARDPEEAIGSDFKAYTEKGVNFGIGQCEVTTLRDLQEYQTKYLAALEAVRKKNNLDWALLMVTDILRNNSVLLSTSHKLEKHLPWGHTVHDVFNMPGVMSRKKQLLPEIISTIEVFQ